VSTKETPAKEPETPPEPKQTEKPLHPDLRNPYG